MQEREQVIAIRLLVRWVALTSSRHHDRVSIDHTMDTVRALVAETEGFLRLDVDRAQRGQFYEVIAHGCTHMQPDCCQNRKVCRHAVACSHGVCCLRCYHDQCSEIARPRPRPGGSQAGAASE